MSIRLFRGRSTPAMRAIVPFSLPLALLVPGVLALHPDHSLAPDDLALPADGLHGCSYLHAMSPMPVRSGPAQAIWTVCRDGNGVLEVCGETAVTRGRRPAVVLQVDLGPTGVHHRLDRQDQPLGQTHTPGARAVVWHLWIFVQLAPDPVAHELAHQREAGPLGHVLDRARDVGDVRPRPDRLDPGRERRGGH